LGQNTVNLPVMDPRVGIIRVPVPNDIVAAANQLVHAPERYFKITSNVVFIPAQRLVLSRIRPLGVSRAAKKMTAAYHGYQERRLPISVTPIENEKYLVLDGNSTCAVAIAAGWPELPCLIHRT
jgi:hypothetical protein